MLLPTNTRPCLDASEYDEDVLNPGYTVEPMTLRFVSQNEGLVVCQQLLGIGAGTYTTSLFRKEDMWALLNPIKGYLQEMTAYTGDILHLACIVTPAGNTFARRPFLLVETTSAPTPEAGAMHSRFNWRHSVDADRKPDSKRYWEWATARNQDWLKANNIVFQDTRPVKDIAADMQRLLDELRAS